MGSPLFLKDAPQQGPRAITVSEKEAETLRAESAIAWAVMSAAEAYLTEGGGCIDPSEDPLIWALHAQKYKLFDAHKPIREQI